jgi:hypothetical protein
MVEALCSAAYDKTQTTCVVPVGLLMLSQGHVVLVTSVAVSLWMGKNYMEVSHRLM